MFEQHEQEGVVATETDFQEEIGFEVGERGIKEGWVLDG